MLQDKYAVCEQMLHPENSEKQDVVKKASVQSRPEIMLAVDEIASAFGMFITDSQVLGIEESV